MGIWEVRGGAQQFLLSRVMCWVAIDRGIRLAGKRSFPAPLARWTEMRDRIYRDVFERFWSPERKAFVQHLGATTTDASSLLMPLMLFISPSDPRWYSTMAAITRDLVSDSLVYRYKVAEAAPDGLHGQDGTFCMCSFWYAECLARGGDVDQARFLFEKMLGYSNHLGLYAEELGPRGEFLGNFPQAFTHLALISAAYEIDRVLSATGRPA
jgi:GH15 family glucan-1,4-alpha-glucosidase